MVLERVDIILGKLALGRSYLSRGDACRIADEVQRSRQTGRQDDFAQAAVRLGYLEPGKLQELQGVLQTGSLICRGSCGRVVRLATLAPEQTVACASCGGPLFVAKGAVGQAPAASDPTDAGEGGGRKTSGQTFLNLEIASFGDVSGGAEAPRPAAAQPQPPAPSPAPDLDDAEDLGGNTFLDLELEMPDDPPSGGGLPPPPADLVPAAGGDSAGTDQSEQTLSFDPDQETLVPGQPAAGEGTAIFQAEAFEPFRVGGIQVLAPIASGGSGMVFRARDPQGHTVALKILRQSGGLAPEATERFRREVLLTSTLDHANLVRVHEAGVVPDGAHAGRPYFTMTYVAGRDLVGWRGEGPRTPRACVEVLRPVCQAMDYAHGRGVIHRDLKPSNVLVRALDGQPLVCDFGLARYRADFSDLTQTGQVVGTPSYMPPEQALGERARIGPPTDVYALGAILYFLLTGRPPFRGPNSFTVIDKVVRQAPEPLNAPGVAPALEAAVHQALAKDPAARFPTCGAFAQVLVGAVGS